MMDQPYNREPATPDAYRIRDLDELWGNLEVDLSIWYENHK